MARTRRPPRKRERTGVRLLVALALSLLTNVAGVKVAQVTGAFAVGHGQAIITPVSLAPLSASDWEHNRAATPLAPKPPPPRFEPKVPPPDERDGTLVELPPETPGAKKEPPPAGAQFLAERNQRVDKETVSRFAQGHAGPVAPVPQAGSPGTAEAAKSAPTQEKQEAQQLARAERARGEERPPGDGPALFRYRGTAQGAEQGRPGGETEREAKERVDLSIRAESVARIAAGPNMDGFGKVDEGDVTALNTREFKYATYMNQIRRRIGEAWYPRVDEAMRSRDPEGKSFFYKQRTVTLNVTLDLSGRVTELDVAETSNIDFYDRLAISSVKQAQPFLNPPAGMFERDGVARFPFSFTVYPADRRGNLFWRPPVDQ
jgi:TonB family protein